jgi:hypothetical protein
MHDVHDDPRNETYVASEDSVSVIDDNTDTIKKTITMPYVYDRYAFTPMAMYINSSDTSPFRYTLMVIRANGNNNTDDNNTTQYAYNIGLGNWLGNCNFTSNCMYVKPIVVNSTSVLPLFYDFLSLSQYGSPNYLPEIARDHDFQGFSYIRYIVHPDNRTVSIIEKCEEYGCQLRLGSIYKKHIVVGPHPGLIAINDNTHIVYIGYPQSGALSVINGFTDKVAVGAIFKVNPPDAGVIKCGGTTYPTNTYIYVDSGTNCTAQRPNGTDFEFNTWTESPLTNRNSTTPIEQSATSGSLWNSLSSVWNSFLSTLGIEQSATSGSLWNSLISVWNSFLSTLGMKPNDSSATLHVDRFAIFTANFGVPHQLSGQELFGYLTGAITAVVAINGALLVLPGWRRTRIQYAYLRECIKLIDNDVGKSKKNTIEKKIAEYYAERKLSEDHRQMLKDKISEYYGSVKGSESDT